MACRVLAVVMIGLCALVPPRPSFADPFSDGMASLYSGFGSFGDLLFPDETTYTVGIGPQYRPDYLGSDNYKVAPDIVFYLKFGNRATVDNSGIELNLLSLSNFQLGPVIKINGGRSEKDNDDLLGMGNIDASLELGAYAKARIADKYVLRLTGRRAVFTGHRGWLFTAQVNALLYQKEKLGVVGSIEWTGATKRYSQFFFGVTPGQSIASGLREYDATDSGRDIKVSIAAKYDWDEKWSINGVVEYSRLIGAIGNSPLVSDIGSASQFKVGTFATYTF